MRRALLLLSILASASLAATQLISSGGDVPLYSNQKRAVNEKATYTASSTETFVEIKRAGGMVQVRTKDGQELWAEAKAGLTLERSFVDAIQGNMDREKTEKRNSENN